MTETGTLYGVGVGPGDPDLVTMKAAKLLAATRAVAFFAKKGRPGNARTIATPHLREDRDELRLEYPFTVEVSVDDPSYHTRMDAFYDASAEKVAARLAEGENVAVLCEGDPFFYGSYMYLHDRLSHRFPTQVIAGVTGMSGCWTVANAPITHGDDILTILPGTLPGTELADRIAATDACVIMKVGRNLPKIRTALETVGSLDRAIYVERGTMDGQKVERLAERENGKPAPYFSMVILPGRNGVR